MLTFVQFTRARESLEIETREIYAATSRVWSADFESEIYCYSDIFV